MNPNLIAVYACAIAVVAILGGTAFSRRLRWPYLLTALLYLALFLGAFVLAVLLATSYFSLNHDHGVPWIENVGIALGAVSGGSLLACLYFFTSAGVVALNRTARRSSRHL